MAEAFEFSEPELPMIKTVYANCNGCKKSVGEFKEFTQSNSRHFWNGKLSQMDWEIKFKVDARTKKLSCDCGNELGKMTNGDDAQFKKKSIELKY